MSSAIKFLTVKIVTRSETGHSGVRQRLYRLVKTCYTTLARKFPVKFTVKSPTGEEKRPILFSRPLSDEEKGQLVQRIAASTPFQKTARLRDFLLYVSERTLKHESDDICESSVGCAVFGRPSDYNPGEDNIVRVEARHLRKRLADYFANEGKEEPWVIVIPKGAYVPAFVPRTVLEGEPEPAASAEPAIAIARPDLPPASPQPPRLRQRLAALPPLVRYAAAALLLVLLSACSWLVLENRRLGSQLASAHPARPTHFPWTAVFNDRPTKIVLSDSCLVLLEDVIGHPLSLNEYVSRSYLDLIRQYQGNPALHTLLGVIASRQYTSLADVALVGKIMQLTGANQDKVELSYARNLNIHDFKAYNFILAGSSNANPWVGLFEPKMKFEFQTDSSVHRGFFRNKWPQSHEQAVYRAGGLDGQSNVSYAVVALLPNLNHSGNVLIIEGTNMEGTEAGVEFLTDPEFERRTARALGIGSVSADPYFETLLQLRTVGGTSKDVEAVSFRTIR